jgi:hypothetical protein
VDPALLGLALEGLILLGSVALMWASLERQTQGGPFAALPAGLSLLLLVAAFRFAGMQALEDPRNQAAQQAWRAAANEAAAWAAPKPEQAAVRTALLELLEKIFSILPAIYFCFEAALLAAVALWLRRRRTRLGLMAPAEPLTHWTAPIGCIWLVVGPVFWMLGRERGYFTSQPVVNNLARNLLFAGLVLYLFQGAIVLTAKLQAWARDPATRAMPMLVMVGVFFALWLHGAQSLFVFLVLMGLFEPWADLRRLRPKKS